MTSREEQETVVNCPLDGDVMVWTNRPRDLTEMRRRVAAGQAVEVKGAADWGDFRIPENRWTLRGFKRTVSAQERERRSAALSAHPIHRANSQGKSTEPVR